MLGTGHIWAGPRLSTTQQPPSIRSSIHSHLCCQRCPPAGSTDDICCDAPPPYRSLPPPESVVARSTNAEGPRGTTHTVRRVKSESCTSPYHSHDGDFLANLAAIQLLSGCMATPWRRSSAGHPCCVIGCEGIACSLEDFHLRILTQELSKHPTRRLTIQTTLHGGTDGQMSLESTDRAQMCAYCRSTPMTAPVSPGRFPSEDLDRRLRSIDNALHRDRSPAGISNKRVHTSEVSRKERSLTADDNLDVGHLRRGHGTVEGICVGNSSRGMLGTIRNLQHKDRVITSPSLDSSEIPSPREAEVGRRLWFKVTDFLTDAGRSKSPVNTPSSRIAQT